MSASATGRRPAVANEAYRAVFLRVHPTGKMVLSLTTDADGKEPAYAQLVADELGVPALDVKVVPADTDRFGTGHGYNTSPSAATPAAIASATSEDPRQGAAARRHGARRRARDAHVVERGVGRAATAATRPRSGRSRTSRCTPTAPARCRRGSRAGSTPRPSTATEACEAASVERDLDLVGDLERAEQGRVGLDAPVGLLDDGDAAERPRRRRRHRTRAGGSSPTQRELALHARPSPRRSRTAVERNVIALPFSTSSSIVCCDVRLVVVAERLHARPCPRSRAATPRRRSARCASSAGSSPTRERGLPGGHVDQQVVARLGGRAGAPGPHREGRVVGPERYVPAGIATARAYNRGRPGTRRQEDVAWQWSWTIRSRRRGRSTTATRRSSTSSA